MTDAPFLSVVRGRPTDEEMAAVMAVLAARAIAARKALAVQHAPARSAWSDRSSQLRRPLVAGPGAWRASALPR